jgi:hypothetical protein
MEIYIEHKGRVVEADGRFPHAMALTLDSRSGNMEGVIRCVLSRDGDLGVKGYTDHSKLYRVFGESFEHYKIGERLNISDKDGIIESLIGENEHFLGLEDADIYIDPETELTHLYFTIPIDSPDPNKHIKIHLGHAVGKDLMSLNMTMPVLLSNDHASAKEVSIAPVNKNGFRYNLVESKSRIGDTKYSTVQIAIARDMSGPWEYGEVAIHPAKYNFPWMGGHVSPGPLLPRSFIDVGKGKLLGILNGREANQKEGEKTIYKIFSIGFFIYDYEDAKVDWISAESFIKDSEAEVITFASHFIETGNGTGLLYAHVDDSFVRAYTLNADGIRQLLP